MLFQNRFPSASLARQGSNLIEFKFTKHLSGGVEMSSKLFLVKWGHRLCLPSSTIYLLKLKYLFSRPSPIAVPAKQWKANCRHSLIFISFVCLFRERSLIKLSLIKTLCVKIDFLWLLEHTNTRTHRTCCCLGNGMSKNIEISNIVKMTWAHMKLQCRLEYSHAYKAIGILGPC